MQLSTYGDSLGTNLKDLKQFIDTNLQGAPVACPLDCPAGILEAGMRLQPVPEAPCLTASTLAFFAHLPDAPLA